MNAFWVCLSSDIDLRNIDLLDTHLDLLDTDISNKHFVCFQDVLKTSSRHVFKTSWRRLQRNNFLSSKTSSRSFEDVFKSSCEMSTRRLQEVFKTYLQNVFKRSWKIKHFYTEDVLKTSSRHVLNTSLRRLEDQQMFEE